MRQSVVVRGGRFIRWSGRPAREIVAAAESRGRLMRTRPDANVRSTRVMWMPPESWNRTGTPTRDVIQPASRCIDGLSWAPSTSMDSSGESSISSRAAIRDRQRVMRAHDRSVSPGE